MIVPLDSSEQLIPPVLPNEIELILKNFDDEVIFPISKALERGEPPNKIKEAFASTIYSDWKEIPNFKFRIMFFPVCPHAEPGPTLSHFKISAYVESMGKEDWPENWICYGTRFCIIIINPNEPHSSVFKRDSFNFSKTETDRGWQGIMSLSQIMENGFLNSKGDLVIRAGVYPVGAEADRSVKDAAYSCREATGFVGLQNHGATCYMNALLQSLYSITKFRKAVYSLSFELKDVMGEKSYQIIQKLAKTNESLNYYDVDNSMDVDTPYPESSSSTYRNAEEPRYSTQFDDNDLPTEGTLGDFLDNLDEGDYCNLLLDEEEEETKVPCVGLALQNLFYMLKYSEDPPGCKELVRSFGWKLADLFTQQDSHELLKLLLDKMEEQMKGTSVEGSVKNIFEGEMETYIECIDIDYKSCRKETFEDIQLDVQGCSNIYESLDRLTEPELLAGENMYEAKGYGKQRANKGIRFLNFPPVVIFLLKRFTFDLQMMDTVKLNTRFEFYKEINLSRYIEPQGEGASKQASESRGKKGSHKGEDQYEYILQAVAVHHGSINSGHYYAFTKSSNNWYRFDDETVTKASEYAVIDDNFGGEEQECYNYLTTNTSSHGMYNNINRFRKNKAYNAYILMYVLKSKKDEILGDVDMAREKYQMLRRCRTQSLLSSMRTRIRERLNRYIKLKIYTASHFQGNTLLNQHYSTWPNKFVLTQDKSTNLTELLKYVNAELEASDSDDSSSSTSVRNGKGSRTGYMKKMRRSDENVDQNFYVLGFHEQFNRFVPLNDIRTMQKEPIQTLSQLVNLVRSEYYQHYDPTVYLLHATPASSMTELEEMAREKEEGKGISSRLKITPKSSLEAFTPTSNGSGGIFTPTSGVFTASLLNLHATHTQQLMVFIKYYDIFSKDASSNLKCLNLSYLNPERNASQLLPMVLQPLMEMMSSNLVTKYRMRDLKNLMKGFTALYQSNGVTTQTQSPESIAETKKGEDSDGSSDDRQILLDEEEELVLDIDNKIEMLMKKESLHLYWYVELNNNFTNLNPNKKMEDQVKNGDVLVCNFRPTDEMRKEIELVERKTTLKEDFEPTTPSVNLDGFNNFVLCSTDKYLETYNLDQDDSLKQYRDLRSRWLTQRDEKMELHKLYTPSIYDYPSFVHSRMSNVKVVFKLYDPLEALATWKNCINGPVNPNPGETTEREASRPVEVRHGEGEDPGASGASGSSVTATNVVTPVGNETSSAMTTARTERPREEGLIDKLEMIVDLRTPCKHVLRYVCWALGVDPCHVLVFNSVPHTLEAQSSHLLSLDDFCYKDHSLGYSQQSLMELFNVHKTPVNNHNSTYTRYVNTDYRFPNDGSMDDEDMDSDGSGSHSTRYNFRRLEFRTSHDARHQSTDENVVYLGVLFEPYYQWNYKSNQESLNVVAQVFNEKVQVVASLMCKVPQNSTVGQLCNLVSQNYYDFLNSPYSSQKRASSQNLLNYQKRTSHSRSQLAIEEDDEWPSLVLVDVLDHTYTVVDLSWKISELPQYSSAKFRNLFSAPLRFVPNWTPEQHDLIAQKKLCPLTVYHQTPERVSFGYPFQVLVSPSWSFLQVKTHIRNTLDLPKREWDRWSFYQLTNGNTRVWKSNDDQLDWDKPGLSILAEHPSTTYRPRHTGVMKIT
ncbi:ubiquitinyl hydrolase 1 [Theileria orientalis]|uniref:Ubiquitinyl hydrolase 1 n=1 Tax=Theileria orientalis TaxID=68886 RepID=A0A976MBH0_THEOR|nr:ubiquitinyl hydrolase 1 [Theileria orientalis]